MNSRVVIEGPAVAEDANGQKPSVSVIVVNYNGGGIVLDCVKAAGRQSISGFELILVDNHSTDGSLDELRRFFESGSANYPFKLISLDRNTGFAGGNIEGLRHASGQYIALLNNDAVPQPGWLGELVSAMDSRPEAGMCASNLICMGTNTIDSAGDGYATIMRGFKRGEGQPASAFADRQYVFGACAGAALFRRKMIDEIGFLDRDFFVIHEDVDMSFRAQLSGWKVLHVPQAMAFHRVRSSIGTMSDMAVYYTVRNSELTKIKNMPLGLFMRLLFQFILGEAAEFLYFAVKHRRLGVYLKAKLDVLKHLPGVIRKRRAVMAMKKVPDEYILSIMTPASGRQFFRMKLDKFMRG